jgi:hypothetical protein
MPWTGARATAWGGGRGRAETSVRRRAHVVGAALFAFAVAVGALAARELGGGDRGAIALVLDAALGSHGMTAGTLGRAAVLETAFVAVLFALGLSVVGLPALFACVALRGVAVGFAGALAIYALGAPGAALAAVAVALPAAPRLALWLFSAGEASVFAVRVARGMGAGAVAAYGRAGALALGAAMAVAAVEAYASLPLARAIVALWRLGR